MSQPIKTDASPSLSPSPSSREPRSTALSTGHITHGLFNGGALDSQVTDSQHINNLIEQNIEDDSNNSIGENSFDSSASSDTTYEEERIEQYYIWQNASSQGEELPKPVGIPAPSRFSKTRPDDPMEDCPRPSSPDFIPCADLNADDIRLSATELGVIAAMRADRASEMVQYATNEQMWYADMSRTHNQCARIAALESLLEYHRIPLPAGPTFSD
ncbi:hypothetical protein B0H13DRAFT_1914990 [Mycena leptocephala]|nr:hypothetical protein B0H13DRAFT_1914990 [Mycena leptocephala]